MSLPRADYDPRRVCLNPFPALNGVYESIFGGKHRRSIGIYVSGAIVRSPSSEQLSLTRTKRLPLQFAIAQWLFLDACILSSRRSHRGDVPVQVEFIDWLPGIFSFLGYIIVNLIDKDRVRGEEGGGDSRAVWRARLFLFVGFAMMAGGLAGSVVRPLPPSALCQ